MSDTHRAPHRVPSPPPARPTRRTGPIRLCRSIHPSRLARLAGDDEAMSTAEYAIGTIAAAAFAALLYTVISGDSVLGALTGIITRALSATF